LRSLSPGTSLVQTLIQLGPEITSDVDTVCALLQRFGISDGNPPRDNQLVEIMSNLARLAAEGTILCDVGALVRALSSFVSVYSIEIYISSHAWAARDLKLGECH
jgi:CCR4-NOT transcription complex subunit 1